MSTDEAPRPDIGPVTPGTLSVVAAATTARSREFPVEFEPETPEYCAESVWLDSTGSTAMVCSATIVDGRCPWHGTEGKRLPVKPTEREDELAARLSEVEAERDAAVAHDRQPYPTADAYEATCHALRKHRAIAARATELLVSDEAYDFAEVLRLRAEFEERITDRPEAGSLANRLAAAEAERDEAVAARDALQRQRDEVWHRIDLWSDDPDTGLDHLLDVWTSHEKALAQVEAWRPVVEAAWAYFDEYGWLLAVDRDNLEAIPQLAADPRFKLLAAVDALPTRNVDSTTPGATDG